jgi:hypothetical protein
VCDIFGIERLPDRSGAEPLIARRCADDHHPFVRPFKVLNTVAQLEPLLQALRPLTRQITLFGSCAEGIDTADSDVDLFILTSDRSQVMKIISTPLVSLLPIPLSHII